MNLGVGAWTVAAGRGATDTQCAGCRRRPAEMVVAWDGLQLPLCAWCGRVRNAAGQTRQGARRAGHAAAVVNGRRA